MELKKILSGIKYELVSGTDDIDIKDISQNSNNIKEGYLFVAIKGSNVDGHDYIDSAIKNGAKAIIVENNYSNKDITVIKVSSTEEFFCKLAINYFNNPISKLTSIAITGTKGKTSTAFMIKTILEKNGNTVGIIGTNGVYIKDKHYKIINTTPNGYDIQKYIQEMLDNKIEYLVMEVSSQALKYGRVKGMYFDYGIFTNLSKDHISKTEHSSMEDYIESKSKLFDMCHHGIFNLDDEHVFNMIDKKSSTINTYGYNEKSDLRITDIKYIKYDHFLGIEFTTDGLIKDTFKVSSPGKFSSYNALAAILCTHMLGIDTNIIKESLINFFVKGRVEPIKVSDKFNLIIDYAHNGISTESLITTIREYNPKRIVTIFGCGGNKSIDRRYEMGRVSGTYSDFSIVTEDNNRFEPFEDIAKDILKELDKTGGKYIVIPDRKEAIKYSIEHAKEGDVILLIGKGHEDYKEINGKRTHFDEREVIQEVLEELKK